MILRTYRTALALIGAVTVDGTASLGPTTVFASDQEKVVIKDSVHVPTRSSTAPRGPVEDLGGSCTLLDVVRWMSSRARGGEIRSSQGTLPASTQSRAGRHPRPPQSILEHQARHQDERDARMG
jgi:hypothetical protein